MGCVVGETVPKETSTGGRLGGFEVKTLRSLFSDESFSVSLRRFDWAVALSVETMMDLRDQWGTQVWRAIKMALSS